MYPLGAFTACLKEVSAVAEDITDTLESINNNSNASPSVSHLPSRGSQKTYTMAGNSSDFTA